MGRNDDIKEYLRGSRKGGSANRLEREALSDPFLFEALEGLMTTPGDPMDGLIRLERQLEERARLSRKKRWGWLYMAASILVLAICGTLWYVQSEDKFTEPVIAQLSSPSRGIILEDGQQIEVGRKENSVAIGLGGKDSLGKIESPLAEEYQRQKQNTTRENKVVETMGIIEMADEVQGVSVKRDSILLMKSKASIPENVVEGTVVDEAGNLLPGVTVMVTGTSLGVATNAEGRFRLTIPGTKAHLTFNFIGMKSQGCDVKAGEQVRIKMENVQERLDEVVVTGYSMVKKQIVAGAVTTMKASALEDKTDVVVVPLDVIRFNQYVEKALQYPKEDLDKNNEGVISFSFDLNKKNTPSRIRIQDSFSKECNKELIRLLSQGPKWENSRSGIRIHATVRFIIGKDGEKPKAVLSIVEPEKKIGQD